MSKPAPAGLIGSLVATLNLGTFRHRCPVCHQRVDFLAQHRMPAGLVLKCKNTPCKGEILLGVLVYEGA